MSALRRMVSVIVHVLLGGLEHKRQVTVSEVDAVHLHVHGSAPTEEDLLLRRRRSLDEHAPEGEEQP